jgi:hypothetical protein
MTFPPPVKTGDYKYFAPLERRKALRKLRSSSYCRRHGILAAQDEIRNADGILGSRSPLHQEPVAAGAVLRVAKFTTPFQGSSNKNLLDPGLRPLGGLHPGLRVHRHSVAKNS